MKPELRQIFGKDLNIKFHQNPPSGSAVVACEHTEGQTETGVRT